MSPGLRSLACRTFAVSGRMTKFLCLQVSSIGPTLPASARRPPCRMDQPLSAAMHGLTLRTRSLAEATCISTASPQSAPPAAAQDLSVAAESGISTTTTDSTDAGEW